ncbi:MAG: potassium-transporting ATPase subunit KdpA [Tepidisphaeraceae bacterium]|jgi:K+-transporting ATPase ATPase A chain
MSVSSFVQYALFLGLVTALVKPAGAYLARVFDAGHTSLDRGLKPVERLIHRLMGIDPSVEMSWRRYAAAFILFTAVGTLLLYLILRFQTHLPGGPSADALTTPMTPDLAMNTAFSFSTTTTWQAYGGESTMKYWTQIVGLAGQNFMAGAAGLAVGIAFIRGMARKWTGTIGNFWFDLVRSILWVLLPLCVIGSVLLIWQGVPMTFAPYPKAATVQGDVQTIARGPVAALEFIKNLGTNGGGFFNANGAHPFEGPTPLANLLSMLAIAVLPASLTYTFGHMVRRPKAGWMLYAVMVFLFVVALVVCDWGESRGNPLLAQLGVAGANMEGKEVRFGTAQTVLAAVTTSNGATGSTNAMHDSFMPLSVSVPLCNMMLGEIVFGGLGTGLYSIVMVALVGVFIAGLMTGRTPEYLGKKIGPGEMKLIALFSLVTPMAILFPTAIAVVSNGGLAGLSTNTGPHGFTEILYAYSSCCANNGQAMAGLDANSLFYNLTTVPVMLAGRFGLAIPALALAGRLAAQGRRSQHVGTLPSDSLLLATVAVSAAVLIVLLSFLPALALGPLLEHFQFLP